MKKFNEYLTKRNVFMVILVIGIIIVSITPYMRIKNNYSLLIGETPYSNIVDARLTLHKGFNSENNLVFSGRKYIFSPYHMVIAVLGYFFGIENVSIFLPLITGVVSLLLFYLILYNTKMIGLEESALSSIILALSPLFIYTFSISDSIMFSVFLMLLGFYFFIKKKRKYFVVSLIFFMAAVVFNILNIAVILLVLWPYCLNNRKKLKRFYILLIFLTAAFAIYYSIFYFIYGLPQEVDFAKTNILHKYFAGLGSETGLGTFTILLAVLGLMICWKHKHKLAPVYALILMLFFASLKTDYARVYLNFLLAVFAGIGFYKLISMKWEIEIVKELTILVLSCGVLFSTASYIHDFVNIGPHNNVVESLLWLKGNSASGTVFSHYSKGFWIEYLVEKPVVMDSFFGYTPDVTRRFNDSNEILESRNLDKKTFDLFDKYNIKYFFVDAEMKSSIWGNERKGLLYLFRNNQTFKSIYDKNDIEIYEYARKEELLSRR